MGLHALVVIGGDGSLSIAHQFYLKGIPDRRRAEDDRQRHRRARPAVSASIPRCDFAAEAIDRLHTTAEAHKRIIVVEVMGRYAGWIALHSGVAGGADVILMPEIPFDLEKVAATLRKRESFGAKFSIVVVAEGAKPVGGQLTVEERRARATSSGSAASASRSLKSSKR